MSVRAYRRLTAPVLADAPTFNLWREQEVLDFLLGLESTWERLDDGGSFEVYLSELKPALKSAKIPREAKRALQADIKAVEAAGEDYIFYECY